MHDIYLGMQPATQANSAFLSLLSLRGR